MLQGCQLENRDVNRGILSMWRQAIWQYDGFTSRWT